MMLCWYGINERENLSKYGKNVSFPCFFGFFGFLCKKKFSVLIKETCKAAKPQRDKISGYYLFAIKFIKKRTKTNSTVCD
jgi:hypothetical protein